MCVTNSLVIFVSGNRQLILSAVIHHLDHKNVSHDPQVKSNIVQIATALAQQIRLEAVISDIGFVSDICRHLRKSLQVTAESAGEQEFNLNISLQNAIEDCLVETVKGVNSFTLHEVLHFSFLSLLHSHFVTLVGLLS